MKKKKGEWIQCKNSFGKKYTMCSECRIVMFNRDENGSLEPLDFTGANYCPHCGSLMNAKQH